MPGAEGTGLRSRDLDVEGLSCASLSAGRAEVIEFARSLINYEPASTAACKTLAKADVVANTNIVAVGAESSGSGCPETSSSRRESSTSNFQLSSLNGNININADIDSNSPGPPSRAHTLVMPSYM